MSGPNMKERERITRDEILEMPIGSLISAISRAHLAYLFGEIEKLGITGGQYYFLNALIREDGIIQEELASNVHMNESTITRALKKLEDAGMVHREVDENNRRKKIITVTEKGRDAVDKIRKLDEEWDDKIRSLSPSEKTKLRETLRTLTLESLQMMHEIKR
jgi:DNA-binding MarR family transcriptional regulator